MKTLCLKISLWLDKKALNRYLSALRRWQLDSDMLHIDLMLCDQRYARLQRRIDKLNHRIEYTEYLLNGTL